MPVYDEVRLLCPLLELEVKRVEQLCFNQPLLLKSTASLRRAVCNVNWR
jgi:hypothetical protein